MARIVASAAVLAIVLGEACGCGAPFTEAQKVSVANVNVAGESRITPKVTAILSMIGSGTIIYMVVKEKERRGKVYHRLLLMMSSFDLLTSFWFFLSTWPMPAGTPDVYGAVGNVASCSAQGFFIQLGLAVPFYNACLSVNYLCTIKYAWTDSHMQKIEPYLHAVAIGFPLLTALSGFPLTFYNSATLWCWIASVPSYCSGAECDRGDFAWIFQWALFYSELWALMIFVAIAMILVYRYVLNQEESVGKFQVATNYTKSRRVAKQGMLYVLAFYLTWIFGTINRLYQTITKQSCFTLVFLHSFFVPLQGFLNFVVYVRPRYLKHREDHPEESAYGVITWVCGHIFTCTSGTNLSEDEYACMENGKPTSAYGWSTKRWFQHKRSSENSSFRDKKCVESKTEIELQDRDHSIEKSPATSNPSESQVIGSCENDQTQTKAEEGQEIVRSSTADTVHESDLDLDHDSSKVLALS